MTALPGRRRSRTIVALVAGLVVAVSLPVFGVAASRTIANSKDGRNVAAGAAPRVPLPSTPTGLLAVVDGGGAVTSATVFALAPSGVGGSIISVPTTANRSRLQTDPASPLAASFTAGGADGVVADVESMLSVTLSTSAVVTEDDAEPLLAVLGSLTVTLRTPVVDAAGTPLFHAGTTTLSTDDAARFLATDPVGVADASHRAAEAAFWSAVVEAVGDGRGRPPEEGTAEPETFDELIARVFAGPVALWSFASSPVPAEQSEGGAEASNLDVGEVLLVMASVAPSAMSAAGDGLTYRIEFGFENSALVAQLIAHLRAGGANISSVARSEDVPATTEIFVADELDRPEALTIESLVGPIEEREPVERLEGIDVVLVLGQSFVDTYPSGMPAPTTTAVTDE